MRHLVWAPLVLVAASTASASSFDIRALSVTNTVTVSAGFEIPGTPGTSSIVTLTGSGTDPVSRMLSYPELYGDARATAAAFNVNAAGADGLSGSQNGLMWTSATAHSTLDFVPVGSGATPLTLSADWMYPTYSSGLASLVNLTTNDVLWSTEWRSLQIPVFRNPLYTDGPMTFLTDLRADHTYRLTLSTRSSNMGDSSAVALSLSGLQVVPVPEPATGILLAIAVGCLAGRRRSAPRPR